jgi:hypothetical protein
MENRVAGSQRETDLLAYSPWGRAEDTHDRDQRPETEEKIVRSSGSVADTSLSTVICTQDISLSSHRSDVETLLVDAGTEKWLDILFAIKI